MQYDFGRTVEGGRFVRTSSLNRPLTVLLTAVTALRARHNLMDDRIVQYLGEMMQHYPKLESKFTFQGSGSDRLFEATYDHQSNDNNCNSFDLQRLVSRTPRCSNPPAIHYGLIASPSQVMRDGRTRDRLRDDSDVLALCFEMEAAGLMGYFPCLVIRGICDYAGPHKNKTWQGYT